MLVWCEASNISPPPVYRKGVLSVMASQLPELVVMVTDDGLYTVVRPEFQVPLVRVVRLVLPNLSSIFEYVYVPELPGLM